MRQDRRAVVNVKVLYLL